MPPMPPDFDVEESIASEHYFTGWDAVLSEGASGALHHSLSIDGIRSPQMEALQCLTICVLVLRNGSTVTGESTCMSLYGLDAKAERRAAREAAAAKVRPLLSYASKDRINTCKRCTAPRG